MITGWAPVLVTLAYIGLLFGVAQFGDTRGRRFFDGRWRPLVYSLGLGVFCTSWTFYGSVGLASTSGWAFLPVYIGPMLVFSLGRKLIARIALLAKSQNITSVADFTASRYGKAESVAMCVAVICVLGTVPYIALQLKAVALSIGIVLESIEASAFVGAAKPLYYGFVIPLALACFAMAFGTRHVDATEHQDGLMLSVATESLVKLAALTAVGVAVVWWTFGGLEDLLSRARAAPHIDRVFDQPADWMSMAVTAFLSALAIILLPRQFHVTIVENRNESDIRAASWMFPLYLVAINLFVIPLAVAGLLIIPDGAVDRDMTVLALPLLAQNYPLAIIAMLGGISAATAMIIVECVALSIMVSNDLVLPLVLRRRKTLTPAAPGDIGNRILIVRRLAILLILALGYGYLRISGDVGLVVIGLTSFACIAQIAPSFFGGLVWRGGSAAGAIAGMVVGVALWLYTLFVPALDRTQLPLADLIDGGPFGIGFLRPTALFGLQLPQFAHGVVISLALNILCFIIVSLLFPPSRMARIQASNFVRSPDLTSPGAFRLWRASVTAGELEATVARYLGGERARHSFDSFLASRGLTRNRGAEADVHMLRFAEQLLASAIGAASARLVLSLVLTRRNVSHKAALRLVDEASAAIQYNRDLLQYALDFARQGITVFDRDHRMICWNREYRELFDLPQDVLHVGVGLEEIVRFNATRGFYGEGDVDAHVAQRVTLILSERRPSRLRLSPSGRVIEIRSAGMPDGGLVTTYTDMTAQVDAEEALEATNETLEQRVRDRTNELERLNEELVAAKAAAEDANLSKTRFLAAASHDILQPLNAARLYATSLSEQTSAIGPLEPKNIARLSANVDASLEAVEEILTTLLDISRLDAGAMKAEFGAFLLDDIFNQLKIEFSPLAKAKGIKLVFVPSSLPVRSDRRLLRRVLQNFVSNAIKYTPKGKALVGVRRKPGGRACIEVWDTGLGIAEANRTEVFREFSRLEPAQRSAPGLGLGLSIVERIARVLDVQIGIRSKLGRGSVFWVDIPIAAQRDMRVLLDANASPHGGAQILSSIVVCAIDNEPRILDGMRTLLTGWGCQVVIAESASAALIALQERRLAPNFIVADFHLDDGDGFSAIAMLRQHFGAEIAAVLVTADRTESMRAQAAMQDVRVLPKPLKPAALRALLAQWRATHIVQE